MTDYTKTLMYKKISDFATISVSSLDKLFKIANQRQIAKGEYVLRQEQICKTIIFVESGYLRIFINHDGNEINSDFAFEGDFTTNL